MRTLSRPPPRRFRPLALCCAWLAALAGGCQTTADPGPRHARAVRHAPRVAPFDVEHYFIDLTVDPEARTIEGTCTVRLWAVDRALREVRLDLARLSVRGVRDGHGRDLRFRHAGETLSVELAERLAAGDYVELSIDYGGTPARGLWFSDVERGRPTQVFTQGQCEDARYWFPCWDTPSDRATSELRVRMPAHWVAVAAGERIDRREHGDGTASEHWRMHDPHPTYLATLVAGEFVQVEERYRDVPLTFLVEAEWAAAVEGTFGATADVLAFMEGLAGRRYPYAKYSQACVEGFFFGGMENVSATTLSETVLRDERGWRDYDPVELVAHEAAHQWFGDLLTCADWSHIWLNEGLATYATLLYLESRRGPDEFRVRMRAAQEDYMRGDVGGARRPIVHDVYVDPLDLFFGGHAYPGGASRLHLLRFWLGDEAFFAGLRRYVQENQQRSVVTADLRAAFEAVSGQDLGTCFEQWLGSGGFPELEWSWRWEDGRVLVEVAQVQDPDTAPAVFETPVDVEVRGEDQSTVHRVRLDRRRQSFEFPAEQRPLWVHLDRFGWIPKAERVERPVEEWLAIASLDEDVNARRDALAVLGNALAGAALVERRSLAMALIERLVEDPSHHVRALAAAKLGGVELPAVLDALRGAAESDPRAAVRVAALEALARAGPDPERAAFARAQFEAGYSWETMGAAARLCGAAAPEQAEGFLVDGLAIDSPHDVLRASLLASLARLGTPSALDRLRRVAFDDSASEGARLAAVHGLAESARQDSALRAQLAELLGSTHHYRLQLGLLEVLGRCEDARVVPALEAFHERCGDPLQRRTIEELLRQRWAR